MASSVVGLDIGNLGSKIGVARNRGIDILVNEVSNRTTPSLVGFGPITRFIGETAKTQETSNFKNTIGSLKRLVGRAFSDPDIAAYEAKYINAELVDVQGQVGVRVNYLGEPTVFTATQLYAMLLGKLRDTTFNETKAPVNDVVIAIPGWYTDRQRRAVHDAAEIAGLRALQLVNDVSATAFGYGITKSDLPEGEDAPPRVVAFVDIGHSDFSVSIAAFKKGKVEIKGSAFDPNFGGRDLDYALCEYFAEQFKEKYKIDVMSNKKALFRLATAVEKLKKILSANAQAPLSVESIMNDIDASSSMTREEFEELVAPLLERTIKPLQEALDAAGIEKEQVDIVELVGGSSRVPAIKNRIQAFFGKPLSMTTNQEEAIARGSTFLCAAMSPVFQIRPFTLHDVQIRPIELLWERDAEEEGSGPLTVFTAGAIYPTTRNLTMWRSSDAMITAQYHPQGAWLAQATVKGIKPAADGSGQSVKVKVALNSSGIFEFRSAYLLEDGGEVEEPPVAAPTPAAEAEAAMTGAEVPPPVPKKARKQIRRDLTVVSGSTSLSQEVINESREREGQMAASDKLVKETEDRKNALEEYIYEARDKIEGTWSVFGSAEHKSTLRAQTEEAETWLYSDEGDDAPKSAYVERLAALKKLGDPMAFRYREAEERPRAQRDLAETLGTLMAQASSGDEKYSHLAEVGRRLASYVGFGTDSSRPSQDELQKVIEKVATTQKWLEDQNIRQMERPKDQDPVLTSAEIRKRREDVLLFCQPILSKPKPKKTEAPPSSTATPTPEAQQQKEAPPATEGGQDAPMTENEAELVDAEGEALDGSSAKQEAQDKAMDVD